MTRQTEEDLHRPERVFYRLIKDYADGALQSQSRLYRARVEHVDPVGGQLEADPPNPPNSVRARIYTSGIDFNLPTSALNIFYPLGDLGAVLEGEHVIVTFEDENFSSGYWLGKVHLNSNQNYSNPDDRDLSRRDASHAFEGDSPSQRAPNPIVQYGGATTATTRAQIQTIQLAESQTDNWRGKKVLHIGDSQAAGAPGVTLQSLVTRDHGAASYNRTGRVSWGVYAWNRGSLRPSDEHQFTLPELMDLHDPDIVVIYLGGNDGSSGAARRADYEDQVRQLWTVAQRARSFAIWCGPPTAVGAGASRQAGRDLATSKILNVVGNQNFVDIRTLTNVTDHRDSLGVHFEASSPVLVPWAQMIINKGNAL